MKIEWLGHAAFLFTAADGRKILTDPYEAGSYGGAVGYKKIDRNADIVTISHDHEDHNYLAGLPGKPIVVKGGGKREVRGIFFKGIPTFHDTSKGRERGKNTIFVFSIDGINVCHLGDLGHTLSKDEILNIGKVDVLLIPVGGYYTIDAKEASTVMEQLQPKITIPMHYKTEVLGFPIEGVDKFLEGKKRVKRLNSSEFEVKKEDLPQETEIAVLKHAC